MLGKEKDGQGSQTFPPQKHFYWKWGYRSFWRLNVKVCVCWIEGHQKWKIIQIISFEIQNFYVFSQIDEKEIHVIHWFTQRKIRMHFWWWNNISCLVLWTPSAQGEWSVAERTTFMEYLFNKQNLSGSEGSPGIVNGMPFSGNLFLRIKNII